MSNLANVGDVCLNENCPKTVLVTGKPMPGRFQLLLPELLRLAEYPSVRAVTPGQRSRSVLTEQHENGISPGSGAVSGLCLLVDRPFYALEHLLVDPAFPPQLSKHSTRLGCTDWLFSNGSKKLTSNS